MAKSRAKRNQEIVNYFHTRYGQASNLNGWQTFCRDVGVREGASITQCKKNLDSAAVNIVDFAAAKRSGQPVHHFSSKAALAQYMRRETSKIFPLRRAKEGTFLRALLIHLY